MGIAEYNDAERIITLHASIFIYGNAATSVLATALAEDIATHWNEPKATAFVNGTTCRMLFKIKGEHIPGLLPKDVYENDNASYNFFRVEEFVHGNISFVDGVDSNTGYFLLENLLNNSTTAAHEFGHSLGLDHPEMLDIRGEGAPGIMYPRGTIVDPPFQYDPAAAPGAVGGTLNPFHRKVLQTDIDGLRLDRLHFNEHGYAMVGDFSSVWHDAHQR
ncbi:peptidase M10 [Ferruginibacter sp. HRS2-29]|uniref:peptidase M10 n=1 Tax=Ferruginibacter sp. HRS2-29 TaxID=2487334 RepID=UPI0020CB783A|nr:peptidase M10 [Ferruginibacter sp. HRS2-29]MCP9751769.1 peptidase M10 [Ferruginibacter sp. HRS2-29]